MDHSDRNNSELMIETMGLPLLEPSQNAAQGLDNDAFSEKSLPVSLSSSSSSRYQDLCAQGSNDLLDLLSPNVSPIKEG